MIGPADSPPRQAYSHSASVGSRYVRPGFRLLRGPTGVGQNSIASSHDTCSTGKSRVILPHLLADVDAGVLAHHRPVLGLRDGENAHRERPTDLDLVPRLIDQSPVSSSDAPIRKRPSRTSAAASRYCWSCRNAWERAGVEESPDAALGLGLSSPSGLPRNPRVRRSNQREDLPVVLQPVGVDQAPGRHRVVAHGSLAPGPTLLRSSSSSPQCRQGCPGIVRPGRCGQNRSPAGHSRCASPGTRLTPPMGRGGSPTVRPRAVVASVAALPFAIKASSSASSYGNSSLSRIRRDRSIAAWKEGKEWLASRPRVERPGNPVPPPAEGFSNVTQRSSSPRRTAW